MVWIVCVRCEKFYCKLFRTKSGHSGPLGRFSHSFSYRNRNSKNALNMSFGSKGMDWVRLLRKIQLHVFSTKSGHSGPPGRFSHSFSYRYRNSKNALNMSFGSKGMDWVRLLRKIQLHVFSTKSGHSGPPGRFSHSFSYRYRNSKN